MIAIPTPRGDTRWVSSVSIATIAGRGRTCFIRGSAYAREGSALWRPADQFTRLALMAMSYHRLGEHDEAQAELMRLQEMMKNAKLAQDEVAKSVLREAEAVVGNGKP